MRIDAHQHFWVPAWGDYGWMPQDDPVLTRPYGPADLAPQLGAVGGTVLVQAAPTVAETEYLLALAEGTPMVRAVVGWIDFEEAGSEATLDRLARHPKFRGVRPMIQDLPRDDWMLSARIGWAYEALIARGLTFDALGFPRHIPHFLTLFARHPELKVVLDHALKPGIAAGDFAAWAEGIGLIAKETGALCKLSGLVTEARADWTEADLRPYVDHLFEVFGPARIMWGSDWPVLRLRCEYARWLEVAEWLTAGLDPAERDAVFGGTAARFYGLDGGV